MRTQSAFQFYIARGRVEITTLSHSISQISMSVLHRSTHVMQLPILPVVTPMARTSASAMMDSLILAVFVKVQ